MKSLPVMLVWSACALLMAGCSSLHGVPAGQGERTPGIVIGTGNTGTPPAAERDRPKASTSRFTLYAWFHSPALEEIPNYEESVILYVPRRGFSVDDAVKQIAERYRGQRSIRFQNEALATGSPLDDVTHYTQLADPIDPKYTAFLRVLGSRLAARGIFFDTLIFDFEQRITFDRWTERMPGFVESFGNKKDPKVADKFVVGKKLSELSARYRERFIRDNAQAYMVGQGRTARWYSYTDSIVAYPRISGSWSTPTSSDLVEVRDAAFTDTPVWLHPPGRNEQEDRELSREEVAAVWRHNARIAEEAIRCGLPVIWFNADTQHDDHFAELMRFVVNDVEFGDFDFTEFQRTHNPMTSKRQR